MKTPLGSAEQALQKARITLVRRKLELAQRKSQCCAAAKSAASSPSGLATFFILGWLTASWSRMILSRPRYGSHFGRLALVTAAAGRAFKRLRSANLERGVPRPGNEPA